MKKILAVFILMMVFVSSASAEWLYASKGDTYVHTEPSRASSTIGVFLKGKKIWVEDHVYTEDGRNWCKVNYFGDTGYISDYYSTYDVYDPEEYTEVGDNSTYNAEEEIEYEPDVKYRNINAIKVMDPEGGVQYYKGGYNNEGQCHGEGIWIKDNNIYIGNFRNDNFHGIGLFITAEGDYYFGEWENSQCNGYGSLMMDQKLEYQGDFRNSRKEGYGEEKYPDGDIYKGLFYQGEKNGKGQYIFADGSRYDGNFKKSKYNGYGQLSLPGGNTIRGDFKDGKLNGKGDFMWNDGTKFVGQFINDEKNGEGLYVWKNGISFKGSWNGNDPYGKGLLNDPSKSIQKTINF